MAKLSKFDLRMFEKAKEIAETSDFDHFHLGCVITCKKRVINIGCNTCKTHPMQKYYNNRYRDFRKIGCPDNHTLHAEIATLTTIPIAIIKQVDWHDVNIYIYRIAPGLPSKMGMARPCPGCMAAIHKFGIRNIYYTTDTGYAYERLD